MALRNRGLAALAFFAALAVVHTWPLAADPGGYCRNDNADTVLNEWILAWVAHALPSQPLRLFDANIFYPESNTLAFSEHLLVPALLVAPLAWLGASPVLAHNVAVLLGLVLTAASTAWVVTRWTGRTDAGLLAGTVAAFNVNLLTRLAHVQAVHAEFLPLALFAFDRLLSAPRARHAIALAGAFVLQSLVSGYLLVATLLSLSAAALVRWREWARPRARRTAWRLAAAGGLAIVMLAPFLAPYIDVRASHALVRSVDEVLRYSAGWRNWLGAPSHVHAWWNGALGVEADYLFPGVVALSLAVLALWRRRAWTDARTRMLAAVALVGFVASFGPAFPPYRWAYEALPLLQGIRGAARLGYLTILATGMLAGFGLARLAETLARRGRASWVAPVAVLLIGLANLEAWRAPIGYVRYDGLSPAYSVLAGEPGAVVAEFPFPGPIAIAENAPYMLASTRHWRPLVNGYSGFMPASYVGHSRALVTFPSDEAFAMLEALGVTHIVVHEARLPDARAVLARDPRVRLIARIDGVAVYRRRPAPSAQCPAPSARFQTAARAADQGARASRSSAASSVSSRLQKQNRTFVRPCADVL